DDRACVIACEQILRQANADRAGADNNQRRERRLLRRHRFVIQRRCGLAALHIAPKKMRPSLPPTQKLETESLVADNDERHCSSHRHRSTAIGESTCAVESCLTTFVPAKF